MKLNIPFIYVEFSFRVMNHRNTRTTHNSFTISAIQHQQKQYCCSVDIRDRDFKAAKRWSDDTMFANRAYFSFERQPGELSVQNAKDTDSGVYRCRVDFKIAQTRNSKVNLTVIRKLK